jgi:predicted transcriptional regulator
VDWAIYGALVFGGVTVVAAAAFLVVRVLQGWRELKRFRRHLARGLNDLAAKAERTGELVERISDQGELQDTLSRLRLTLTKFNVLRAAVDEVSESLTRVAAVYPRK